jgi:glycine cleavage system H protein
MKRYSEEHQWIECQGAEAVVGITAFAADELGELNYVELPAVGTVIAANEPLCVVESVKAASDVLLPVGGRVVAVNERLEKEPALINKSPEGDGWICRIEQFVQEEVDALMDAEAYSSFIA